jgi:hypothetical protein
MCDDLLQHCRQAFADYVDAQFYKTRAQCHRTGNNVATVPILGGQYWVFDDTEQEKLKEQACKALAASVGLMSAEEAAIKRHLNSRSAVSNRLNATNI